MADDQPLTALERTLPSHLGGHFGMTNVDGTTLRYLATRYTIHTMLDVGCGVGGMIDEAATLGIDAIGIDGDHTITRPDVLIHDFTTGPISTGNWDLIWCVEFVEHVDAEFIPNFMQTFAGGRVLFLTAAPPGFPGHHHVNCQPADYWIVLLDSHGWALDRDATQWVRANGGHPFSTRQGLVFVRS